MYARRGTGQWRLVAVAFTLLLVLVAVLLLVPGKDAASSAANVPASEPVVSPPPAASEVTPTPAPENPYPRGSRLKMTDGVNLRVAPNLQGAVLATVPVGHEVTVLEGPREADGYRWWRVETAKAPVEQGWMAEGWWERIDSPLPAAATPAPAATGTPAP